MVVLSQIPTDKIFDKNQKSRSDKVGSIPSSISAALPPTAVLFDWDNTLVDTWKTIFYAVNDTLLAFGLEPWTEEFALSNIQRSGREAFPKWFGDKAKEAQTFFYRLVEEDNLQGLNPMPGAEAVLEVLVGKGIPVGIISNKKGAFLRKEVAHLGWGDYFGTVVGAGDALRDKPAADPVLLALESLKVPPSQKVWIIGDAPVDWDCALAAGCQPVAIGKRFEPSSPMIVSIENCGNLKKIFIKM
ncbi:MAG: HAD family hydrolase [Alphaproteobacteria bacterium]|nr:HAD family hydrolase [Alphaproteobacteria bacterium]